jgi:DNA-binding MarR family transcriptional regulator
MTDRADIAYQQWRRERPDLDPFPMAVLARLAEATFSIARDRINPLFARYGLQQGEFDVLATLRRAGLPYELTPTRLYEAAMISSGGMTSRLDRMEINGWILRKPHPTDRRGTLVALTEKGLLLIDSMLAAHVANGAQVLSSLQPAEQEELHRLLAKLIAGGAALA